VGSFANFLDYIAYRYYLLAFGSTYASHRLGQLFRTKEELVVERVEERTRARVPATTTTRLDSEDAKLAVALYIWFLSWVLGLGT
jgi:hypothetical protein